MKAFPLIRKESVALNGYRFVFGLPNTNDILGLPTGQSIALRATINEQSVWRSYTLVLNNTDIRGPKGAIEYSTSYAKCIRMIACGTGITLMCQLIRVICDGDRFHADESVIRGQYRGGYSVAQEADELAKRFPNNF